MTTSDAGAALGRIAVVGGVAVDELGLVEGDLGVAGVVVNLHGLDVRCGGLTVGALVLGVAALLDARPIGEAGLAAAPVGGGGVDLGRDLLGGVLLRLGLASHWRSVAEASKGRRKKKP